VVDLYTTHSISGNVKAVFTHKSQSMCYAHTTQSIMLVHTSGN